MGGHAGRWRTAVAGGLVLLATACSIGDIRRRPPAVPQPAAPVRPAPRPDEVRRATVPVPADYVLEAVEFVDAWHGYVLFVCGPARGRATDEDGSCPAVLLATADGGVSWQWLRHPRPDESDQGLFVADKHLVLRAGPDDWYVSADRGRTFTHLADVTDVPAVLRPRFQIAVAFDGSRVLQEWVDGRFRLAPTQPPVPGLASVAHAGDRLVAVGVEDGRPYAALSYDRGRRWRPTVVPPPDARLASVSVEFSPDGANGWLLGTTTDPASARIWRLSGPDWLALDANDHPGRFISAVPLGAGLLALTGTDSSGVVVVDRFRERATWPVGGQLRLLADQTLLFVGEQGDSIWLGVGRFADRNWISLVLDRL